jgi:hypothetical protein
LTLNRRSPLLQHFPEDPRGVVNGVTLLLV